VYILGFLDVKIVSKLMTVSADACFRDFVLVVVIVMVEKMKSSMVIV